MNQRKEAAEAALKDMFQWFEKDKGAVAIYDATNGTRERRAWLYKELSAQGIKVLFIESLCDDENVILANIRDVKLSSPDYEGMNPDDAAKDFMERIEHYKEFYETITEDEYTYIKLVDVGKQYIINKVHGYLESKIVYYLMNLHVRPKRIWFSRVSPFLLIILY